MKKTSLILCVLLSSLTLLGQESEAFSKFKQTLDSCQLKFKMPQNFIEVPIKKDQDLHYEYAIKHKTYDYEIRFSIMSLKPYFDMQKDSNVTMVNPNKIHESLTIVNVLNLSGQNYESIKKIGSYPSHAVKEEYGADSGNICMFQLNSTFGEGYKSCFMSTLHKDDVADVCVTYLFNDFVPEQFKEIMFEAGYSLKFK